MEENETIKSHSGPKYASCSTKESIHNGQYLHYRQTLTTTNERKKHEKIWENAVFRWMI